MTIVDINEREPGHRYTVTHRPATYAHTHRTWFFNGSIAAGTARLLARTAPTRTAVVTDIDTGVRQIVLADGHRATSAERLYHLGRLRADHPDLDIETACDIVDYFMDVAARDWAGC